MMKTMGILKELTKRASGVLLMKSRMLLVLAWVHLALGASSQERVAKYTVKVEAIGIDCGAKADTVHQFAVKFADQHGLWTVYSPIAASRSIRIKGDRKYGVSMVITKVNLEADICQLMPLADEANKGSFDRMFPFKQGLDHADVAQLPNKLWYVALAGAKESFQAAGTSRNDRYASLREVPLDLDRRRTSLLPEYVQKERITGFLTIEDTATAEMVVRRFVGGPVWGEGWKKEGMLGIIGGVVPLDIPNHYLAWVIRPSAIMDRSRYKAHSTIPQDTRNDLKRMACAARLPAVVAEANPIVEPTPVSYDRLSVQKPLYDRMVTMLGRFREFRAGPRTKSEAVSLCDSGNLDISAAYDLSAKEQQDAAANIGFGTLVPMMACIHEEYCRNKDRRTDRTRPDFRGKVVEFNRRIDYLSPIEMQALAEAGLSRPALVEFAQELFVLSHHNEFMARARRDTAQDTRSLCSLRQLQDELVDWRVISSRIADYPSEWLGQVEELEYRARRLGRMAIDSLEAELLAMPLDFEEVATLVEGNRCLTPEESSALLARIMRSKQPKPEQKRVANITHAERTRTAWTSRVKSIAALERLPNWEFTYVSFEDSVVMSLRISGGKAVEKAQVQSAGGKKAPPAARACSYGFPLGSVIYPECIPAIELFAAFVDEHYFEQDNGFSPIALRIIGSADNTPIRSKLHYPPEILRELQQVRDAENANHELAYARAFYARYLLYEQNSQWPSMLSGSTSVTGIEVGEAGEQHRNIQLVLVVVPKGT
jgi:hypothetical protein